MCGFDSSSENLSCVETTIYDEDMRGDNAAIGFDSTSYNLFNVDKDLRGIVAKAGFDSRHDNSRQEVAVRLCFST